MDHLHYPQEYTRWWVEFYYQRFLVNENVLIPRFETEDLVRKAIRIATNTSFDVLIDIGTGTGIIPISILSKITFDEAFAVDISPGALNVAKKNAENLWVKNLQFLESNLLSVFVESGESWNIPLFTGENILLTTNLPYIKQDDWENMSKDTRYEPSLALFWGEQTGFELYEKLFSQIPAFLENHKPTSLMILAEMGEDQEEIATRVLKWYGWEFSFFADAFGIRRFMKIEI